MKSLMIFLVLMTASLISNASQSPNAYLCITSHSVGFAMKGNSWESANFTSGDKYILKKDDGIWKWTNFGSDYSGFNCDGFTEYGNMVCSSHAEDVSINRDTLRFKQYYKIGYVFAKELLGTDKEKNNTPSLSIGTCSAL